MVGLCTNSNPTVGIINFVILGVKAWQKAPRVIKIDQTKVAIGKGEVKVEIVQSTIMDIVGCPLRCFWVIISGERRDEGVGDEFRKECAVDAKNATLVVVG